MIDIIAKLIVTSIWLLFFGGIAYAAFSCDLPVIGCICSALGLKAMFTIIFMHIEENNRKHLEIVRHFYKLPARLDYEFGEVWDEKFQTVIKKAIGACKEADKRTDLQECQRIAKNMIKDSDSYRLDRPFYKINNAFRLTGCHLTITDAQGKIIIQIV